MTMMVMRAFAMMQSGCPSRKVVNGTRFSNVIPSGYLTNAVLGRGCSYPGTLKYSSNSAKKSDHTAGAGPRNKAQTFPESTVLYDGTIIVFIDLD